MVARSRFPIMPEPGIVANCFPAARASARRARGPSSVDGTYLSTFSWVDSSTTEAHARLVGLDPAQHVQAPAVAGLEPLKRISGRGVERSLPRERLNSRNSAVTLTHTGARRPRPVGRAATVAEEAGERRVAAREERSAQTFFSLERTELMREF